MRKWDNDDMVIVSSIPWDCPWLKKNVCAGDPARSRLTWVIDNIILECSLLTIARHKQHKKIAWKHPMHDPGSLWGQLAGCTLFDWASGYHSFAYCHVMYTYRFDWHWLVMPRVGGALHWELGTAPQCGSRCPKSEFHQRKGLLLPLAAASYCPSVDGLRFVGLIGLSAAIRCALFRIGWFVWDHSGSRHFHAACCMLVAIEAFWKIILLDTPTEQLNFEQEFWRCYM